MKGEIRSYGDLRERLMFYADETYQEFAKKGILTERPILGVKIPQVREIVNLVPREKYLVFLNTEPVAFEEVLARGMIIARLSYVEILDWFDSQVSLFDDWASCDTFCSGLSKIVKKHREEFLELKIEKLLGSDGEFTVRAGLVLLKIAYVEPDYLALIFDRVEELIEREEYYIRTAIAWLIAECFIKYPEVTLGYLRVSKLPKWTFNKTISKICDSYRVDEEMKVLVRKMRR